MEKPSLLGRFGKGSAYGPGVRIASPTTISSSVGSQGVYAMVVPSSSPRSDEVVGARFVPSSSKAGRFNGTYAVAVYRAARLADLFADSQSYWIALGKPNPYINNPPRRLALIASWDASGAPVRSPLRTTLESRDGLFLVVREGAPAGSVYVDLLLY